MTDTTLTPMLRQYQELKQQHPGTLLFFRLGDFYELFFDDAVTGSRELQITLTARHKEHAEPIPMCGVPHHSAANDIARLVRKGYRVAICEQTEEPSKEKKLVRREVVRIVTPGTPVDPQLLEPRESVYLAATCAQGETVGAAFLDISTGEFRATQASGTDAWAVIASDIGSYSPRELIFPASLTPLVRAGFASTPRTKSLPIESGGPQQYSNDSTPNASTIFAGATLTPLDDWLWQSEDSADLLKQQFGVRSLDGHGLTSRTEAIRAAGACLRYARETQRAAAAHISDILYFEPQDHLVLDSLSVRNLELVEGLIASISHSLLDVIDETATGMGARLLRHFRMMRRRKSSMAELFAPAIPRNSMKSALSVATLNKPSPPWKLRNARAAASARCGFATTTSSAISLKFRRPTLRACLRIT